MKKIRVFIVDEHGSSFRETIEEVGFEVTEPTYFEAANLGDLLAAIESSQLVVLDLDGGHYGDRLPYQVTFVLGYALSRGKTLIGLRLDHRDDLDKFINEAVYVVESMAALKAALKAFKR